MRLRLVFLAWIVPAAVASGFACGSNAVPQHDAGVSSSSSSGGHTGGNTGTTASTGGSSSASTGGGGSGGSGCSSAHPPAAGPPKAPDGTGTVTFAVSKLYLGDTDPDGKPDPANGWTHFGYDIDGLPPGSKLRCMPWLGGPPVAASKCGVQNSFAQNALSLLELNGGYDAMVNQIFQSGAATVLITLSQLGSGASYDPLSATVALGGKLGSTPHFDGTDMWPVVAGTQASFEQGYVVGNTWVSGPGKGSITVPLTWGGDPITVQINHPIVTMVLDAAHQKATGGIIAGVVPTDAFANQLVELLEASNPGYCTGEVMTTAFDQIYDGQDILDDGTQDPKKPCDALTIGLGFDALPVQLGPTVQPPPPMPNPCATDAGPDDAGPDGG
jgi:hypothetical protein